MAKEEKDTTIAKQEATVSKKIELTKDELDAILTKAKNEARQEMAMAQAKEEVRKALEEKQKEDVYSDVSTRQLLNEQQKYKVIVYPAEGERQGQMGVININGVKFTFKYGEETILPEAALEVLKNSKSFGEPKLVKDADGGHYEPVMVQKRAFNAIPAHGNTKLN